MPKQLASTKPTTHIITLNLERKNAKALQPLYRQFKIYSQKATWKGCQEKNEILVEF